ncbi:hypothetical protein SAMN05660297_03134 [Natronincola peptidivorans]|uniref:Ferredoxin n=1 Tax=Natronincola peptidivorans TaxID=426128 RepID=A0A1I0GBK8_9FIRM|nr:four-helix bundle copper-binding protein [Natronincola peptidivorans]SET68112.1 hypothetical protein SAMN05660297_03134 [Natronincola peptidivorans]
MENNRGAHPMHYHGGYHGGHHHHHHHHHHQGILDTLQRCEEMCEHMTTFLKRRHDVTMRKVQLELLRDCADICTLTAKFIARNSSFARGIAGFCAYICEVCGVECAKFPDRESQECARICFHCAKECRAFAGMH